MTREQDGESEHPQAREMPSPVPADFAQAAQVSVLGDLTASLVHEVNQPLASLMINIETALRWLDRAEPNGSKAREAMKRALDDARRTCDVVAHIWGMAAGRAPQLTALALNEVIAESMTFLRHEFQSKGVSISLDLAEGLPQVTGDRTQLQQIVLNLAINAVQAMTQAGTARRRIFIRTMRSGPETVCCVLEDSGPGIDPKHLPQLFDSFFTTKDTGMGLGLRISRSIIKAHDGDIRADNNSDLGGARFSFTLPANVSSSSRNARPKE
jgi:C4-dicarboxylate-specific signal transduction histidine kinase